MKRLHFLCFGLLTSLFGCQSLPSQTDASAQKCCETLNVSNAIPLSLGAVKDIEVSETSLLLITEGGTARAIALALPSTSKRMLLELFTEKRGFWMPAASVYVPYVVFLSQDRRVLEQREPRMYRFHGRKVASSSSSLYQVVRVPSGAKYLIVTTAGTKVGTKSVEYWAGGQSMQGDVFLTRLEQSLSAYPRELFADEQVPAELASPQCCAKFMIRRDPVGEVRLNVAVEVAEPRK